MHGNTAGKRKKTVDCLTQSFYVLGDIMPTYDYKCNNCNIIVEEIRSITDESELLCATCGDAMQVLIRNCNFVLMGSWTGRDIIEKNERESRSEKLKTKTKERELSNDPLCVTTTK